MGSLPEHWRSMHNRQSNSESGAMKILGICRQIELFQHFISCTSRAIFCPSFGILSKPGLNLLKAGPSYPCSEVDDSPTN